MKYTLYLIVIVESYDYKQAVAVISNTCGAVVTTRL